ncbi:hypothetical protein L21SP4_02371 [Kiritimatiella glycovorans]|uniref:Uncharacterized protein n=1 Tax=Kiritimatiella glycovorans TaxID=1307763 RepID=A0A0G3EJH6_9BACT|nr:hypothetical protein L21SP4_02371 [Kiritimatiella glycovorans]
MFTLAPESTFMLFMAFMVNPMLSRRASSCPQHSVRDLHAA